MKIRHERERRFSYERYIDNILNKISCMEVKGNSIQKILDVLKDDFESNFMITEEVYKKHLSPKMMNMIDRFSSKLSTEQAFQLVKKALEYNSEVSSFKRVVNAFTVLEYYNQPEKFDEFKQNWKRLMRPDK